MRRNGKVSGIYEVDSNFLLFARQLAENFDGVCHPLAGGVALLEIAAMVTPGTVAARFELLEKIRVPATSNRRRHG